MESNGPLSAAVFHILLALGRSEKHGYEIMQQVKRDTGGAVKMGTGTLYGSIKRMLEAGLIEETGDRADREVEDQRRRYYRATERGSRALADELRRYRQALSLASRRRVPSRRPEARAR